jgi:Dihaem cytochrome c
MGTKKSGELMKKRLKWIGILGMLSVFILGGLIEISADEYRHRERKRHSGRDDSAKKLGSKQLQPVTNPAYKETCGGCHFAYQPELLPTASWAKLLSGFDDHFGQTLDIDSETLATLTDYLKGNGADKSSSRQAARIMKSLGVGVPIRITDVPYIRDQHHEISSDVFSRKSIGSLSNCSACHRTAENGVYDDDFVEIPK